MIPSLQWIKLAWWPIQAPFKNKILSSGSIQLSPKVEVTSSEVAR